MATDVTVRSKIKIKVTQAAFNLDEKTKGLFLNSEKITRALKASACFFYACLWPSPTCTVNPNTRELALYFMHLQNNQNPSCSTANLLPFPPHK